MEMVIQAVVKFYTVVHFNQSTCRVSGYLYKEILLNKLNFIWIHVSSWQKVAIRLKKDDLEEGENATWVSVFGWNILHGALLQDQVIWYLHNSFSQPFIRLRWQNLGIIFRFSRFCVATIDMNMISWKMWSTFIERATNFRLESWILWGKMLSLCGRQKKSKWAFRKCGSSCCYYDNRGPPGISELNSLLLSYFYHWEF